MFTINKAIKTNLVLSIALPQVLSEPEKAFKIK